MADSIAASKRAVVAMQKLYLQLLGVTLGAGDMSFSEYGILASVHDHPGSMPVKELKRQAGPASSDLDLFVAMLERKELLARVRNAADRRGFALECTAKGKQRLAVVDQAVSAELVSTNPRMTERAFLRMANVMHALSGTLGYERESELIFTGATLFFMNDYHARVMQESSYFGMTSLQMAVLCMFDRSGAFHAEQLKTIPAVSPEVLEYQIDAVQENGCIQVADAGVEITQKGVQRLNSFTARLESSLAQAAADLPATARRLLDELCECYIYLYA